MEGHPEHASQFLSAVALSTRLSKTWLFTSRLRLSRNSHVTSSLSKTVFSREVPPPRVDCHAALMLLNGPAHGAEPGLPSHISVRVARVKEALQYAPVRAQQERRAPRSRLA